MYAEVVKLIYPFTETGLQALSLSGNYEKVKTLKGNFFIS